MREKLTDAELNIMNVLWKHNGRLSAAKIFDEIVCQTGWHRNTVYTHINKCIKRGAIERYGTRFMCKALVDREEVQKREISDLVIKLFEGSYENFIVTAVKAQKSFAK